MTRFFGRPCSPDWSLSNYGAEVNQSPPRKAEATRAAGRAGGSGGGGGPSTVTFLGSAPFLLRLVKEDSSGRLWCCEGAACDEAVEEGEAAVEAAIEAGEGSSGLLGGETERPQPKRPRRKLEVAVRFRWLEEDCDDEGTGLDSSLMAAA